MRVDAPLSAVERSLIDATLKQCKAFNQKRSVAWPVDGGSLAGSQKHGWRLCGG
jgi:hypothetical protein